MAKTIIQVPMDGPLLEALDRTAKKLSKARSEIIRQACRRYLGQLEAEELDRSYRRGYEKYPEEPATGELQMAMVGEVLPGEDW